MSIHLKSKSKAGLSDYKIKSAIDDLLQPGILSYKKILLLPPDLTRAFSYAGVITNYIYHKLKDIAKVDIMPALGTHQAMTKEELSEFFGDIPYDLFIAHDYRNNVVKLGQIPGEIVSGFSEGVMEDAISISVNKQLFEGYDLILSIGQVVPHEVVGMSNYNKNIFVGCGGSDMIDGTHILGSAFGMERIIGRDHSPVHKVLDYAENNFLMDIPLKYILTVTTQQADKTHVHGLFCGREREIFEAAVALSQEKNITFLDEAPKKIVVMLDEKEFKSAWLGNKAIYRTRMAVQDGGEVIILAPGVKRFGETDISDMLIRKYGYVGKERIMQLCRQTEDLGSNLAVACHMTVSSTEDRFRVTYASKHLNKDELESVGFGYMDYYEAISMYNPKKLKEGYNSVKGEEVYFIGNPTIGLWAERNKFEKTPSSKKRL